MNNTAGQTVSLWMQTFEVPANPVSKGEFKADVCVVGAGIAGMTTAYLLAREGKSVIVLDDGPIGGGQTQRTTAHLTNAIDDRYLNIERWHGTKGAKLAADSHTAAIERIESIVQAEKIDCDFQRLDGYLFVAKAEDAALLQHEYQAAHRAGLSQVETVPRAPLEMVDTGPCLRFPGQAQFHPLKYLSGLANAFVKMKGRIFTPVHVDKVDAGPPAHITTSQGSTITAESVVVATNTPFNDYVTIHTKQAAYMTYVLAFGIPKGSLPKALYWDTQSPYHYVRLYSLDPASSGDELLGDPSSEDLLIVGGEDHKTGQADNAEARYALLESWARNRFRVNGQRRSEWSGQVFETIDGLAFIGRNPLDGPNIYIATGDSGQGMTHGTIAGILLTDLICERPNQWAALYDPTRKSIGAAGRFLQENLNVALQYGDWVTAGDVGSVQEIATGNGAVVRRGLKKVAAYRDDQGELHECSAVCPHLGCIVQWNHSESTWDCPCHGSRFDKFGKLLIGPSNVDLPPA